jgi:hypothetical protein
MIQTTCGVNGGGRRSQVSATPLDFWEEIKIEKEDMPNINTED